MPWSLYGRSKSRPSSGEVAAAQEAELGSVRRGQSLDISRTLALSGIHDDDATTSGTLIDEQKKNRRSSFAAWRNAGSASPSSSRTNAIDGEVELQPGHATPFTAFGVRGGFAVYSPSTSSSSPASGPRHQYAESQRSEEDDNSAEGASLYTPASSITRVIVSPTLTPVDSGFAEFGPDSVIEREVLRDEPGKKAGEVLAKTTATAPVEASDQTAVAGHKKTRSRGWFSFNSSSLAAADTPAATPPQNSSEALAQSLTPVRDSAVHPSSTSTAGHLVASNKISKVPPTSTSTPAATPAKTKMTGSGFLSRGQGRKRGDSEVSLKDISTGPL